MKQFKFFLVFAVFGVFLTGCLFSDDSNGSAAHDENFEAQNEQDINSTPDTSSMIHPKDEPIEVLWKRTSKKTYTLSNNTIHWHGNYIRCIEGGVLDTTYFSGLDQYAIVNDTLFVWDEEVSELNCRARKYYGGGPGLENGEWTESGRGLIPVIPDEHPYDSSLWQSYCDRIIEDDDNLDALFGRYIETLEETLNFHEGRLTTTYKGTVCPGKDFFANDIFGVELDECNSDTSYYSNDITVTRIIDSLNYFTGESKETYIYEGQECIYRSGPTLATPTKSICEEMWHRYLDFTADFEDGLYPFYYKEFLYNESDYQECRKEKGFPVYGY